MKNPEWDKEINKAKAELNNTITANKNELSQGLSTHTSEANTHRAIFVSTSTPTSSSGKDGDIWIVYE